MGLLTSAMSSFILQIGMQSPASHLCDVFGLLRIEFMAVLLP